MKIKRRILATLLTATLMVTSLPAQLFAQETTTKEHLPATALVDSQTTTPGAVEIKPNKYVGDGYEVEFNVKNQWKGAFNGELVLTNTADKVLENWTLKFDFDHEITNIWNAKIVTHEADSYTLKNMGYNQDIAPGSSISIEFEAICAEKINMPQRYDVMAIKQQVSNSDYDIDFKVTSDWGQAFNGEISITNNTEESIEDWTLEFDYDREIERFWTAEIIEHKGEHYVIKNAGYNANILPNQTITLGFAGNPGNVNNEPANYLLEQIGQEVNYEIDTDSDGLPDWFEKEIGTSIDKQDTDGDGLSDYVEICFVETDPLKVDSNDNGINDGDEDYDKDGLANAKEIESGTKIHITDSDHDGLKDGEEVNTYRTNPNKEDTDEDKLTDFEEIALGLDPLNPMTDGVTPDAQRTFTQTLSNDKIDSQLLSDDEPIVPCISGNVSGLINKNVSVGISDIKVYKDNRAVVGDVLSIQTDYDRMGLALNYDVSKVVIVNGEIYAKDLVVCKIGGDDGLIPIDTTYKDNNISANIYESGNYLVINANDFLRNLGVDVLSHIQDTEDITRPVKALGKISSLDSHSLEAEPQTDDNGGNYKPATYRADMTSTSDKLMLQKSKMALQAANKSTMGMADIVFVIDSTGSMGDEINNVAANISSFAEQLVSEYNVNANFAAVEFQDIIDDGKNSTIIHTNGLSNWFSMYDVNKFKNTVNSIYAKDGGDIPETDIDGLETAHRLDWRSNANKFIILVTDAPYKTDNRYGIKSMEEEINLLLKDDIVTSVITSSYYKPNYEDLYTRTNGIYANIYGNFSKEILTLADKIGKDTNQGKWVILDDYQVVKLNDPIDDPDGDTDDDGIKDYSELGATKSVSVNWAINKVVANRGKALTAYTGKTSVDVYSYSTNPVINDTDYDGINDNDSRDLVKRDEGSTDANAFSGKLYVNFEKGVDVNFRVDYRDFFDTKNTNYNKNLSVLASLYAAIVYHNKLVINKGTIVSGEVKEIFTGFGLEDFDDYSLEQDYKDDDLSEVALGHRLVNYQGVEKEIIVAAVRGTNSTVEEWSSNFDVGTDTGDYWDRSNPYWRDKKNHKGFDVAANRLYDHIIKYVNSNVSGSSEKVIYIMGHSRGAAIANILGKKFEENSAYKSYTYTFATPNSTTASNASSYGTIYNIVNSDDIIPQLPLSNWNFTKYGKTYTISVEENYEDSSPFSDKKGTFEWLTGKDYNNDGGTNRTLNSFKKIASNRNQIYEFDNSDDGVVNPHNKYHTTSKGASKELEKVKQELVSQRLDKYSKAYIDKGIFTYQILVRYKPAFLMQILANMTTGNGPTLGYDVRGKYADAKRSFVLSSGKIAIGNVGIGGMAHPHFQETYYLIASNDFKKL